MRRYTILFSVLIAVLFLTNILLAGDVEDIRKITMKHFATLNSGEAAAHIAHHHDWHTTFSADGGLLQVNNSLAEEQKALQEGYDAGVKLNLELRHVDVKIYGKTAVVTSYVVGTATAPDGTTQQSMDRRTAVLVKMGNAWKEVHLHSSPVQSAPSQ